jgi:hypothetical protein
MSYYYSDPSRENDQHALPDFEVFADKVGSLLCWQCDEVDTYADDIAFKNGFCPQCGVPLKSPKLSKLLDGVKYWYAFGFPGCLWDSDPVGPYDTEEEAIEAAREKI